MPTATQWGDVDGRLRHQLTGYNDEGDAGRSSNDAPNDGLRLPGRDVDPHASIEKKRQGGMGFGWNSLFKRLPGLSTKPSQDSALASKTEYGGLFQSDRVHSRNAEHSLLDVVSTSGPCRTAIVGQNRTSYLLRTQCSACIAAECQVRCGELNWTGSQDLGLSRRTTRT
jgi:hypothetical protein